MAVRGILLVEGKGDLHVFWHLFEHHRIPEDIFELRGADGFERLHRILSALLRDVASGLECIGAVVDADADLPHRWQSLRDLLIRRGYTAVPEVPLQDGTLIDQEGEPRVGVWLMPDNSHRGILEDFAGFLIRQDDPLWQRARRAVDRIPAALREFPPNQIGKAYIHTWLAWQKQPGQPMGSAIKLGFLNADAPHAHRLINWIRRLYDIPDTPHPVPPHP